ncbi:hypothetical protein [Enorma massiliensis]|uniref:hypothetical protein n=1 Tax=Enorma massiliensis TaxID=1472761 RepID=UPI003AF045FD
MANEPRAQGQQGGLAVEYMTVKDAAQRWNVTERLVQRLCAEGRVDGAVKFGRSRGVPVNARKPNDPRRADSALQAAAPRPRRVPGSLAGLMPLMNTPFASGTCAEFVDSLAPGPRRDIAQAEFYYFSGRPQEAVAAATRYLVSEDFDTRLSACLICAYANLPLGRIDQAKRALEAARGAIAAASEGAPQLRAAEAFIAQAASVLLHLPAPEGLPHAQDVLPPGLRAFA